MALGKWGAILCPCECRTFCWLLCPDWFLCWVAGLVLYLDHHIVSTQMCWLGPVGFWKLARVLNAENCGLGHFSLTLRPIFCSLSVWIPLGTSLRHKELPDPLHGWGIRGLDSCPAQGCLPILCRLRCVVWLSVGLFLMLRLSSSCVQGNGPRGAVFLNSSKPIWRLWPSASRFHPGKREFASIHDSLLDPSLSFPPSTGKKEWTSPFSLWQRFPWLHIWLPWFLLKRYGL